MDIGFQGSHFLRQRSPAQFQLPAIRVRGEHMFSVETAPASSAGNLLAVKDSDGIDLCSTEAF